MKKYILTAVISIFVISAYAYAMYGVPPILMQYECGINHNNSYDNTRDLTNYPHQKYTKCCRIIKEDSKETIYNSLHPRNLTKCEENYEFDHYTFRCHRIECVDSDYQTCGEGKLKGYPVEQRESSVCCDDNGSCVNNTRYTLLR